MKLTGRKEMKKLLNKTRNYFIITMFLTFILSVCSPPESELRKNIKSLSSENHETREQAAKKIGELKDPKAVEPLIKALNDKDSGVRRTATIALGKIGDAKAVEPLINRLYDEDSEVVKAALHALANIGIPSIEPLARLLRTATTKVRILAATGLGSIGSGRAVDPLIAASRDSDSKVRKAVVIALSKINDSRAVEAIANMMNDEDSDVANTAAQGLRGSERQGLNRARRLVRNFGF
jgi:HEAT repeat protein